MHKHAAGQRILIVVTYLGAKTSASIELSVRTNLYSM